MAESKIVPAKGRDETDWFFPQGPHLYFCPFCGKNVKGKGYGTFDLDDDPKAVNGLGSMSRRIDQNLMSVLDFPEGTRFPTDLIDILDLSIRVNRKIQRLSKANVSKNKMMEDLETILSELLKHLPYHQRGLKSLRKKLGKVNALRIRDK